MRKVQECILITYTMMAKTYKNGQIVIFLGLYFKIVSDFHFGHCANNDSPFMNPSSHPHLSVSQQGHLSSQRGVRLKLSLKNVQWPLRLSPSLLEPDEH